MKTSRLFLRLLAIATLVVVLLSGGLAVYQRILNPKFLKVNGQKVRTQDVMEAYYQMNPEVSKQIRVSRQNAIEAFLLRQKLYQDYVKNTQGRWIEGSVIDVREAHTTEVSSQINEVVQRYLIASSDGVFSVYTSNPDWIFPLRATVRVQLDGEFTTLGQVYKVVYQGQLYDVRFSSRIKQLFVVSNRLK